MLSLQITWLSVHASFPPVTGRGEVDSWFLTLFRWMISWWWASAYRGIGIYLLYVLLRSFTHSPFLAGMGKQYKDPIVTLTTFSAKGGKLHREIPKKPGQRKGLQWEWKLCSWSYNKAQAGCRAKPNLMFFSRTRHTGHTWRRLHIPSCARKRPQLSLVTSCHCWHD